MIKSILVTGKSGQLGQSLQKIANNGHPQPSCHPEQSEGSPADNFSLTFVGRDQLDLANPKSIADFFKNKHFDAIINCAAYTAVDKAESEPELADQINHLAVKQLADLAKAHNIFLVHISTDYVFDGTNYKPYVETDKTNPINIYGLTKLKGEQAIQASGCTGTIIRTSWVYSEFGNNFVKTMLRLGKERDSLNVIFDQVGSPTYAIDLANAIFSLLRHPVQSLCHPETKNSAPEGVSRERSEGSPTSNEIAGKPNNNTVQIYHYANEGVCSWYDFAKTIFELSEINCQVNPIETKDYPTPAKRPHYSVMNKAKIKQIPGLAVPYWKDSLKEMLENWWK